METATIIILSAIALPVSLAVCASTVYLIHCLTRVSQTLPFYDKPNLLHSVHKQINKQRNKAGKDKGNKNQKPVAISIPLSKSNWRLFNIMVFLTCVVLGVLLGNHAVGLITGIASVSLLNLYLCKQKKQECLLLEQQIHALEIQMAENSRAGLSVDRSLRVCLDQSEKPLRNYLERIINELNFSNCNLANALWHFAELSSSRDAHILASVISVQQETGSNLAKTLDFLSESITEKLEMRQTLRSRVAETKLTRTMVALSPLLIIGMCCLLIEGVSEFYTSNPLAWGLLGVCALGELTGLYLLNRISDIRID